MYLNIHVVRVIIHPRGLKVTHTTFKLDAPGVFLYFLLVSFFSGLYVRLKTLSDEGVFE